MPWKPLPDPDKPGLPYRAGFRLSIRRHVPIPPFGHFFTPKPPARDKAHTKMRPNMTLSKWCLMYPPSASPPHPDPTVSGLQIIDEIVCKDGRGAQLVRCRLDADPERILVAKIFDAFYYHPVHTQSWAADATRMADSDYSREAGAYEVLRDAGVDGKVVPKYYGSWTFDLPVPEALQLYSTPPFDPTRFVRMILYEWIDGVSIEKLLEDERVSKGIPPALRLEVVAKGMEALCIVESLGVKHRDFYPRNVIVSPATGWTMSRLPAVFLIDFNVAHLTGSPHYNRGLDLPTPLPMNPRYRFFCHYLPEFGKWIPNEYNDSAPFNGWLASRWDQEDERFLSLSPEDKEYYLDETEYESVPIGPESPARIFCAQPHWPESYYESYYESHYGQ